MTAVHLMLFRKTIHGSFSISKRQLCHHKPPLTGVVDWVNGYLDVKTRRNIENHWQAEVTKYQFNRNDPKSKMYILAMFPYPSGSLHMGHVRVYTISDTMARYYRMQGKNVFHPMGWDSFGLPAENAARERGVDPKQWTELNISQMRDQLEELGFCFDWKHEVSTCDPKYYRWTQWLFLKLYHAGLVYKKESFVNWDPVDKTVLADEQVDENNCSWRSGAQVEKKLLRQWFIRASLFSESLQTGLQNLRRDDWHDIIKVQSNWIGKVNGTTAECKIMSSESANDLSLTVWLRRPEQFRYASFIAVAKGNMLDVLEKTPPAETLTAVSNDGSPVNFTIRRLSAKLLHPLTGKTLPIFVVNGFLNFDHGAETYVGAPEFFEKDRQFLDITSAEGAINGKNDLKEDDRAAVCEELQKLGIGGYPTSSSARDWLVSRQRFWGTPIPMINCDKCYDAFPVPFEDLPVTLPSSNPGDVADSEGRSPLFLDKEWLHTKCPKCGGDATRETDTMDTFVDSSWYYLRFLDPHNSEAPFKTEIAEQLMPVDLYVGGKEHANLHLYFARLVSHFLHSEGYLPQKEPFQRLLPQGMIMGRCYIHPKTGRFLTREEVDFSGPHPIHRESGDKAIVSWDKMSKSKHNGVSPANVIQDYGVDTTRLIMLADAIPQSQKNWSPESSGGVYRWQNRIFGLVSKLHSLRASEGRNEHVINSKSFAEEERTVWESRNKCVSVVNYNYEDTMQFSVGITSMQGCSKFLQKASPEIIAQSIEFERCLASLLIMMAPMAPHFSSELWQGIATAPFVLTKDLQDVDWTRPVLEQQWPQVDMDYKLDLIVEVNGMQVSVLKIPRISFDNLQRMKAQELAVNSEAVRTIIGDKNVDKVFLKVKPGYRGIVNLLVPNVEVSEDQIMALTRAAKKKVHQRAKKEKKANVV